MPPVGRWGHCAALRSIQQVRRDAQFCVCLTQPVRNGLRR